LSLSRSFPLLVVISAVVFLACGGGGSSESPQPVATKPEITAQPTPKSATVGHEATFSISANGTPPLSYQWRKGGTNIPGADEASYTTPATTLDDNGSLFSVVVSNAAGDTVSNTAKLTVNPVAVGNTYYLDANNGSDTDGDGSEAKPYQTVAKLWPKLAAGDVVVMASGNYPKIVAGRTWDAHGDVGWNATPVDVFPDWVTFRAGSGQEPHVAAIDIGTWNETPAHAMPWTMKGNGDAYLRFEGLFVDDGVSIIGSRHVEVRDCKIQRLGDLVGQDMPYQKTGVVVTNGRYITIEGCEITHVALGAQIMTTDFVFRNNEIHHNTHDGMQIYGGDNLLIEGNKIHDLDDGLADPLPGEPAISWNMHVDGIHIYINNYAEKMATDLNGLTFRGNTLYHLEAMGIMVNGVTPPDTNYRDWLFENNVFGPTGGIMLHLGGHVVGFVFRHNTIVSTTETSWTSIYRGNPCTDYGVAYWGGTNEQIYNNLFVDGRVKPDQREERFAYVAHNLYVTAPPAGNGPLADGEAVLAALPYASGDWTAQLLPGSQAIDAGTRLGANQLPLPNQLNVDINGNPRDNRPDIGAYEIQGRNPPAE